MYKNGLGNQKQIYEMAYAEIKACELSQVLRVVSQCVISSQALLKEGSTGMYPKVFVGLVRGSYRDIGCEVPLYPVVMAGKFIRELYRE